MSEFQEDMIFKEVSEEDARIFLDILGKKSKKVKIMTTELRQLDPTTFVPDIILELDDEILIIELQSTKVGKKTSPKIPHICGNIRLQIRFNPKRS